MYGLAAGSVTDVKLVVDPENERPELRVAFDIQPDLAFGPNDAELAAWDARIPAHIDNAVDTAVELYDNSRRVLDAHGVNRVGCDAGGAARTAKEEIQGVDAV